VKKIKTGFLQAILSVISGIIITTILGFLVARDTIPGYSLLIFTVFNLILNIIALKKMRSWGMYYTLGWLAGTLLLRSQLSTADFVLNIIFPVLILVSRFFLWLRQTVRAR
jgi:hypothetical protein